MSDYTIATADEVQDPMPDNPGERKFFTGAIGSEQVAFSYMVVPAGSTYGPPGQDDFAHGHKTQEEIYFVVSGNLEFKLGDDVVDVGPKTAVRVAPTTTRAIRNTGTDDAELVICSVKVEDLRAEVEFQSASWPD